MRMCRLVRLLCVIFFPGLLILALFTCNAINPMALMFMTDFWVTNNGSRPILVTPIGTVGRGHRRQLDLVADSRFYWPAFKTTRFKINPGETRKFVYDWDDIQFSELLIEAGRDKRVLIVDPEPTKNQYRRPEKDRFVVGDLRPLPQAPPTIADMGQQAFSWGVLYLLGTVVAIPVFWLCGRSLKR
jgi:hypothetical protein